MFMRKFLLAAMAMVALSASAQSGTAEKSETSSFWSNCFVSAGVGPQVLFSDHDRQLDFGDRVSPALDIAVGKWFKPWVGVRLMYSGVQMRGATRWGAAHSTGEEVPGWGSGLHKQKFGSYHVHADALFNLTNAFGGYDENRVWNGSVYAGIGVMGTADSPATACVAGDFGILNTFRVAKDWDVNLDLRGTLVQDKFDGEEGEAIDGVLGLTVGVTYRFALRGW